MILIIAPPVDAPEKLPYAINRYQTETNRLYQVLNDRLAAERKTHNRLQHNHPGRVPIRSRSSSRVLCSHLRAMRKQVPRDDHRPRSTREILQLLLQHLTPVLLPPLHLPYLRLLLRPRSPVSLQFLVSRMLLKDGRRFLHIGKALLPIG